MVSSPLSSSIVISVPTSFSSPTTVNSDKNLGLIKISSFLHDKAEKLDAVFDFKNATVFSFSNEGSIGTSISRSFDTRGTVRRSPLPGVESLVRESLDPTELLERETRSTSPTVVSVTTGADAISTTTPTLTTNDAVISASLENDDITTASQVDLTASANGSSTTRFDSTEILDVADHPNDSALVERHEDEFTIGTVINDFKECISHNHENHDDDCAADDGGSVQSDISDQSFQLFDIPPSPEQDFNPTALGTSISTIPSSVSHLCRAISIRSRFRSHCIEPNFSCLNCQFLISDLSQLDRHLLIDHPGS